MTLGILSAFLAVMSSSMLTNLRANRTGFIRLESIHAAQTVLDELRFQPVNGMRTSGSDAARSIVVNGARTYEVIVTYCLTATYCTASSRHLTAVVRLSGQEVYRTETVYSDFGNLAN